MSYRKVRKIYLSEIPQDILDGLFAYVYILPNNPNSCIIEIPELVSIEYGNPDCTQARLQRIGREEEVQTVI